MFAKERLKLRRTAKRLSRTSITNYLNVTRTAYHIGKDVKLFQTQKTTAAFGNIRC